MIIIYILSYENGNSFDLNLGNLYIFQVGIVTVIINLRKTPFWYIELF